MYKINDILYTKDGRKSGNLIIVDIFKNNNDTFYKCISDYGNELSINVDLKLKGFYKTPGKATKSHKHYNYKKRFPENFL